MRGVNRGSVRARRSPNARALRSDARRDRRNRPASSSNRRHRSRGFTNGREQGHATSPPRSASQAHVHRACRASELRLTRETASVAAGTSYTWYTLASVDRAACSMIGYPGVAILDAQGRIVQHAAVWSTHPGTMPPEPVRRIVLANGQQARFVLASIDVTPTPGCRAPYAGNTLQVYAPNQTAAILEPYRERFCNLIVGPLQPPGPQRPDTSALGLLEHASRATVALLVNAQ